MVIVIFHPHLVKAQQMWYVLYKKADRLDFFIDCDFMIKKRISKKKRRMKKTSKAEITPFS